MKRIKDLFKKKFLLVGLLVLFMVGTTGTAFAYWAGAFTGDSETTNETVVIGEAENAEAEINVSLDSQTSSPLVPEGRSTDSVGTTVEEVIIEYDVLWEATQGNPAGIIGALNVSASNVLIDGDSTHAGLVNIDINISTINIVVNGDSVTVTIIVTLTEPSNQSEYEAIAGKNITFDLLFSIDPN